MTFNLELVLANIIGTVLYFQHVPTQINTRNYRYSFLKQMDLILTPTVGYTLFDVLFGIPIPQFIFGACGLWLLVNIANMVLNINEIINNSISNNFHKSFEESYSKFSNIHIWTRYIAYFAFRIVFSETLNLRF